MDIHEKRKVVDVEKILQGRIGKKARFVPTFVKNWMRIIIHEEELNQLIGELKEKKGVEWLCGFVECLKLHLEIDGKENLPSPQDGHRYTFVSNHPKGFTDGLSLSCILGEHFKGNFKFIGNDFFMELPELVPYCIPISKIGERDPESLKNISKGFESDSPILIFPAGGTSRKINGTIHDKTWTSSFVWKSIKMHRDVIPIHVNGSNSESYYRFDQVCKFLRIKTDIPMFLSVNEMFKDVGKTFHITIGKPIPWQTFDKSKSLSEWANYMEELVYQL